MEVVGSLEFAKTHLDVYSSLDIPLFAAKDVAEMLKMDDKYGVIEKCERDEIVVEVNGKKATHYITELGLYNVLAQSRKLVARKWRRVINQQLIDARRARNYDILQQFDEWDSLADVIYFDDETGKIMQSVTLPGGDVDQVVFEGNFEDYLK